MKDVRVGAGNSLSRDGAAKSELTTEDTESTEEDRGRIQAKMTLAAR